MSGSRVPFSDADIMRGKELYIIAGISGSGKSTALSALEDLGFFCVDNLPAPIVPEFVRYLSCDQPQAEEKGRFALLLDCQDRESVRTVLDAMKKLEAQGLSIHLLYFDSSDEVLQRRFREARRPHPLLVKRDSASSTISEAIAEEREILADLREHATYLIDSSSFSVHDLRKLVTDYAGGRSELLLVVESFGFKFGLPTDADMVIDVRFLPNPHFVQELRPKTGQSEEVRNFVFQSGEADAFLQRYIELFEFLLPRYKQEGKRYLTVALGCTGGKHRSVAIAETFARQLETRGEKVILRHRDLGKE